MTLRRVLIVGAGIAGPVLAHFLRRFGIEPVVVERAEVLRATGQTVDLRGAGQEVARRMGVEAAVRERTTREVGLAFVDAEGRTRAAFSADSFGGGGLVSETEILRGELVQVLYEHTRRDVEYVFGDHPTAILDRGDRVQVRFAGARERDFDLVVGADGIRSRTRRMVFSDAPPIHYLDMYTAYFTVPYSETDGRWARWYNAPGGRAVLLRPDNQGTTRAYLSFRSSHRGHEELDVAEQKRLLRRLFADVGFEAPRVLQAMETADDFYFEAVGQVKLGRWSKGRVALVGDAGYCASPLSGMGTSLALVGAYILAGELGRYGDHAEAFPRYERLLRPYVARAQKIPPGAVSLASPRSRVGLAVSHAVLGFAARPAITRLLGRLTATKTADRLDLPDYATQRSEDRRAQPIEMSAK